MKNFILIIILSVQFALAQDKKLIDSCNNYISISSGIDDFHEKDEKLSNLIFRGICFSAKASYLYELSDSRHLINAHFSKGAINSDLKLNDEVRQITASLDYTYLRKISRFHIMGKNADLFLGGCLKSYLFEVLMTTSVPYYDIQYEESWYWSHSINFSLSGEYKLNELDKLSFWLNSPLMSLVSRPDYSLSMRNYEVQKNFTGALAYGEMDFFWNNIVIDAEIKYNKEIASNVDLQATYEFSYTSTKISQMLRLYSNNLYLGVCCKF
jgi:hypothetical protein